MRLMHARARSLSLDGRYHSPSGEASGYEPHAQALGTTVGCFIDRLWSRPSRFNDLALLECIKYMRRSGSQSGKLSGRADWRWLTLHLSHIFDKIISKIYCKWYHLVRLERYLQFWTNLGVGISKNLVMMSILNERHLITTCIRPTS